MRVMAADVLYIRTKASSQAGRQNVGPGANVTSPLVIVSVAVSVTAATTGHFVSDRVARSRPQPIERACTKQKTKG